MGYINRGREFMSMRTRNENADRNDLRPGTSKSSGNSKTKAITALVIFILMMVSAAGPVGIVLLFVFGVFAFIIGVMYFVLKSQNVDLKNPKKIDIMRTIREKSEKEGDPMFKEDEEYQKGSITREDYARLEHCSHEESLKCLLEAGIIDRAEYADRMRELNCSSAH